MKLTPISFNPFDNPARRIARAEGGMALQRTAPFPDAPEGYEFYGPTDEPAKEKDFIPGVGSEGVQAYSPDVQENAAPGILGAAATNIADWYKNQPSWMERAGQQTQKDIDAYTQGGPGAMFDDTQGTQDLAGGFAGSTTPVARAASEIAQPFYSAVSKAIAETPQPKASGEQWAATLRNRPGVKSEEMEWTGLEDWLKEQKGPVSKQQIADYIRANQIEVKEVMKGARTPLTDGERQELATLDQRFAERDMTLNNDDAGRAAELRMKQDQLPDAFSPTKHSKWQMPGGENYREMLLTLPTKNQTYDVFSKELKTKYGDQPFSKMPLTEKERTKLDALMEDSINETDEGAGKFKSSHFDEPNVLAHIRFNDRMIDGKKTLFVEEVQSDWHQKGKREGYATGEKFSNEEREELSKLRERTRQIERQVSQNNDFSNEPLKAEYAQLWEKMNELDAKRLRLAEGNRVPDAPFKTTWPELAMKRIIRYAAENGYDKVAWTPGDVQAARYDLSKHVDEVRYYPDQKYLGFKHKGSEFGDEMHNVTPEKLADYVGKDVAEKLLKTPKETFEGHGKFNGEQYHGLSGLDLKVGGEGMKGFYDQILPAAVNKLVKKHGVKVGKDEIPTAKPYEQFKREFRDTWGEGPEEHVRAAYEETGFGRNKPIPIHSLDITPSLRKSAMEQGFPQFARGGAVKVTKASVGYSKGMPKSHCGICEFYRDATCSKVQGEIAPEMWCRLFKKEAKADGGKVVSMDTGATLTPVDHNPFMPKPKKPVVEAKPPVAILPPPKPNKAAGGAVTAPPITYDAANRVVQELRSGGRVKPMADEPDKAPIEAIPDPIPEKVEQVPERPPEKPVDKPAEPSVMEQLLGKMIEVLQEQKKEFANLAIAVAAPKKLVRDENNNITGSETVLPKEEPKSNLNVVVEKE